MWLCHFPASPRGTVGFGRPWGAQNRAPKRRLHVSAELASGCTGERAPSSASGLRPAGEITGRRSRRAGLGAADFAAHRGEVKAQLPGDRPATELGCQQGLDRHAIRWCDVRVVRLHSTDTLQGVRCRTSNLSRPDACRRTPSVAPAGRACRVRSGRLCNSNGKSRCGPCLAARWAVDRARRAGAIGLETSRIDFLRSGFLGTGGSHRRAVGRIAGGSTKRQKSRLFLGVSVIRKGGNSASGRCGLAPKICGAR